jgi:glyoxylase-like metal-dependent hydrolase (beta-lactamase superfamily II)
VTDTFRVRSIEGNRQRLDGGAMFGNAPRALWQRWCQPDAEGRIPLACRALLVEDGQRRVLCETGVGAFFAPEQKSRYGVEEAGHVLLDSLAAVGLGDGDIDVVVLSHLHFDHAGGLLAAWREGAAPSLLFPRATFVVSAAALERARRPHPRDRASYIPELPALLEASGRLEVVTTASAVLGPAYRLHFSEGHTPGLMLLEVPAPDGPLLFAADLIPGVPWVHVPITMGYDRFPERLIDEKRAILTDLHQRGGWLFFTHDPEVAAARVGREGDRFVALDPRPRLSGGRQAPRPE